MQTNVLPRYDASDNATGCCPRFKPAGWDRQDLHFENKLFLKARVKSDHYAPIDMTSVFSDTFEAIDDAGADPGDQYIVLSEDVTPEQSQHYFSVSKPAPGAEMVTFTGDYRTKVVNAPYAEAPRRQAAFRSELLASGFNPGPVYSFYTTCPKCAEAYGENYIVLVAARNGAQVRPA